MRIWYSVQGEGLGHAFRSEAVLNSLRGHEILITASERAYDYLSTRFKDVHRIEGGRYVYMNNEVRIVRSTLRVLMRLPRILKSIAPLREMVAKFDPDLLISDFEPLSYKVAGQLGLPILAIDNIQELTECEIEGLTAREKALGKVVIRSLVRRADRYIITSFSQAKPLHPENTVMVGPIVRKEIEALLPANGKHVLVYQTSPTNTQMLEALRRSERKFRIYGMNEKSSGNLVFVPFDAGEFLKDFSSCAYVIINGGFTVISEALYLRKPVLAVPVHKQVEQVYNGACLERLGYGLTCEQVTSEVLERFERGLPEFRRSISRVEFDDKKLLQAVNSSIEKLARRR